MLAANDSNSTPTSCFINPSLNGTVHILNKRSQCLDRKGLQLVLDTEHVAISV